MTYPTSTPPRQDAAGHWHRAAAAALLALFAVLVMVVPAHGASLEQLLDSGNYEKFVPKARAAAAKGDADALFLLGKAAHLGKGQAVDLAQAATLYQQARDKGSARASHNLGLLALNKERREDAIVLFEEALARGLKMPTLRNLGLAWTPPDPVTYFDAPQAAVQARHAGDYYAQATALQPDPDTEFLAARQYLRAWMFRINETDEPQPETTELRALAVKWLQAGIARNHGGSWTNYGVLLLTEKDYAGARAALEQGAAQKVPVAMFQLAEMAQRGLGLPAADSKLALNYYEQAALLGLEEARLPALRLLEEQLRFESDIPMLERGVARMAALAHEEDFEPLNPPAERLAWLRYLAAARQAPVVLPDLPVLLKACELGIDDTFGLEYNVGLNTDWRLVAYNDKGDPELLGVNGLITEQGCAESRKPLPPKVRALLNAGAVLALHFPNYTVPLRYQWDSRNIILSLPPVGTVPRPRD